MHVTSQKIVAHDFRYDPRMSQSFLELVCSCTDLSVFIPEPVDPFDPFWTSDSKLLSDDAEST